MKKLWPFLLFIFSEPLGAQGLIDFEGFSLPADSFYQDTGSTPFQTGNAVFSYEWTKGLYPFWSGGFSYTNRYDSSTAGFTNLYGVKAFRGYNGSATYVVGQDKGTVRIQGGSGFVHGFYYTNSTYAYLAMRNGDAFCRKFGDTTGSGATNMPQGGYPDYFKLLVRGYRNGVLLGDSVEIFLADFRDADNSKDYIVSDWRYAETWKLGLVDSIRFYLRSSDVGAFGMNTPAFFALDDFQTGSNPLWVPQTVSEQAAMVFPNPCSDLVRVRARGASLQLQNMQGEVLLREAVVNGELRISLEGVPPGVYVLALQSGTSIQTIKLVKE